MSKLIYVECDADVVFIKTLLPPLTRSKYDHSGGKTAVIKRLLKKNDGEGHIGLVDKDPGSQPAVYYNKFAREMECEEYKIELLKAPNGSRLIVLSPNLEGWIITSAHHIHINLHDYGLPDDEKALHKALLKRKGNQEKFANMLSEIIDKSPHIKEIKRIFEQHHR